MVIQIKIVFMEVAIIMVFVNVIMIQLMDIGKTNLQLNYVINVKQKMIYKYIILILEQMHALYYVKIQEMIKRVLMDHVYQMDLVNVLKMNQIHK